jgi:hypothetical protein
MLSSIQDTAFSPTGELSTKPPVTFQYGPLERNLVQTRSFEAGDPDHRPGLQSGRRFPAGVPPQGWPALDSTLIDLDADGRVDRLVAVQQADGCSVEWWRNDGNGFRLMTANFDLPVFRYEDEGSGCSLSGQFTRFHNLLPSGDPTACDRDPFNRGSYLAFRFLDMNGDGLPDLATALHYDEACYDPLADPVAVARWNLGTCEPEPFSSETRRPLESCNSFPWQIYWNRGGGVFDLANPTLVHQPIPLESDTGDASLGAGGSRRSSTWMGLVSSKHSIIDIDGDGFLDGVRPAVNGWDVFRGDGSGLLRRRANGTPYGWSRPPVPMAQSTMSITGPHEDGFRGHALGQSAFLDMNGDGLVDILWTDTSLSPAETFVYLSTGSGFATDTTQDLVNSRIPLGLPNIRYARPVGHGTLNALTDGVRTGWRFPFDYDQDGRTDFFLKQQANPNDPATTTDLVFGDGSGARTARRAAGATEAMRIPQILAAEPREVSEGRWEIQGDLLDIDGDGATEFVQRTSPGTWTLYQDQRDGAPMRLLRQIENGAGGTVQIAYRSSTDPQIDISGTDDRLGMPSHIWLVQQVTKLGLVDQQEVAQFRYGSPVWNRDELGRYGFRGFTRVHETSPAGSLTSYRYDYDLDWSGRLVAKAIYDVEAGSPGPRPASIEDVTWQRLTLFGGAIPSFQVSERRTRTCSAGQGFSECAMSGALRVESSTWEALAASSGRGPTLLFARTSLWSKQADEIAEGDVRLQERHLLFASSTDYRLRPLSELVQE